MKIPQMHIKSVSVTRLLELKQVTFEDVSHGSEKAMRCVVSETSPISHSEVAQWLNFGSFIFPETLVYSK